MRAPRDISIAAVMTRVPLRIGTVSPMARSAGPPSAGRNSRLNGLRFRRRTARRLGPAGAGRNSRWRDGALGGARCPACDKPCETHVADCEVGGRAVSFSTLPRPAPASVSQVSKPAVSPASQPAGPTKRRAAGIIRARRRFGNLRYNRRLGVSLSLTRIGSLACCFADCPVGLHAHAGRASPIRRRTFHREPFAGRAARETADWAVCATTVGVTTSPAARVLTHTLSPRAVVVSPLYSHIST